MDTQYNCGNSIYWQRNLRVTAKLNSEYCDCWRESDPKIMFTSEKPPKISIICANPRETCIKSFDKTLQDLTPLFNKCLGI